MQGSPQRAFDACKEDFLPLTPRYSIVLPAYNGGEYLRACIESVLVQGFQDYELIVSDDHSTDDTAEILRELTHPRLRVVSPPRSMSMAEHWEWALSLAKGDWLMFLGQDDGVQSYFFELANILTAECEVRGLKVVTSERAHFYWPGYDNEVDSPAVSLVARPKIVERSFRREIDRCLQGEIAYFQLPAMYTSSLVHRSVIDLARARQGGKLFVTHPQDANLVAVFGSLEEKYLESGIPLGWVGSSPKSAGSAITSARTDEQKSLRDEYLRRTASSELKYSSKVGPFSFGSCTLYLWGALLQTSHLRKGPTHVNYQSRGMALRVLSGVLAEMDTNRTWGACVDTAILRTVIDENGVDPSSVFSRHKRIKKIRVIGGRVKSLSAHLFDQIYHKVSGRWRDALCVSLNITRKDRPELPLGLASGLAEAMCLPLIAKLKTAAGGRVVKRAPESRV